MHDVQPAEMGTPNARCGILLRLERHTQGVVRKEDDSRKRKRSQKAQRRTEEESRREQELRRLKNLKRQDINKK